MSYTFPARRIAHTRRAHVCTDCGTPIPIDAPAVAVCGIDVTFWYGWTCVDCAFEASFEAWQDDQMEKHLLGHF